MRGHKGFSKESHLKAGEDDAKIYKDPLYGWLSAVNYQLSVVRFQLPDIGFEWKASSLVFPFMFKSFPFEDLSGHVSNTSLYLVYIKEFMIKYL